MIAKLEKTEGIVRQNREQAQNTQNGSKNEQRINDNRTISLERTAA